MISLRFLIAAMLLLDGAAPTTQPSGPLGKPIQLFNGHDLSNWVWYQRPPKPGQPDAVSIDAVWSVHDGILHTTGKPTGYIRTETSYNNYVLTVEQRHINKGNGGVLFALAGPDKIWPHSLEAQSLNGEEGDIRNIAVFKMTMDSTRVEPMRLRRIGPSSEKPPGEWETFVITVDHGKLTLTINGVLQNFATNTEPLEGKIGLQSEGGELEYRKIELTPIEEAK